MAIGYDVAGPQDAPALVLVHGSVVTRKMWLPQLRGLSDAFKVIAPDLPGHGAQAHLPWSFGAAVDILAQVIRQQAGGKALVAGLSLGGYAAIELAAKYPELVSGLALSGCSLNFTGALGVYLKAVSGLAKRGWLKQSRAQAEAKTRRMFSPEQADVEAEVLKAGVYPDVLGPSFGEMAGRDFTLPLAQYGGPGVIVNGENDKSTRKGEGRFAAALRPGRVQPIPGAGHACSLDNSTAYNQAVRDFAKSIGWV